MFLEGRLHRCKGVSNVRNHPLKVGPFGLEGLGESSEGSLGVAPGSAGQQFDAVNPLLDLGCKPGVAGLVGADETADVAVSIQEFEVEFLQDLSGAH